MSERLSDKRLEYLAGVRGYAFQFADVQDDMLRAIAELRAARVVVEAAKAWRGSQVDVSSNPNRPCYIDADDGNSEQGLMREPVRNALVHAIDALAGAK